jgi:geranylgeranyl pyrophosphate synthase
MSDPTQAEVSKAIMDAMGDTCLAGLAPEMAPVLAGGKMLRGNLVLSLASAGGIDEKDAIACAAAVEMIHGASLVHDDVIDGGELRRGAPSLWKEKGTAGAILLGDLLVCKAFSLLSTSESALVFMPALVKCAGELCDAESEQELLLRGMPSVWNKYLSVARRKTGSLFAFAAQVCGKDEDSRKALEEAGYAIGTAYQIADDFYDVYGDRTLADKSLGRDAVRDKGTAQAFDGLEGMDPVGYADNLLASAEDMLDKWQDLKREWASYMGNHFKPAIDRFLVSARSEVSAERYIVS